MENTHQHVPQQITLISAAPTYNQSQEPFPLNLNLLLRIVSYVSCILQYGGVAVALTLSCSLTTPPT
jgi:hypothetical protein